jgi:pilus assembly protein CpaC
MKLSERVPRRPAAWLAVTLLGATLLGVAAPAATQPAAAVDDRVVREVVADGTGYGGQLALPLGGSQILRFDQRIGRVMIGDPKVADVIPLGDRTLYVLGKGAGVTSLTVISTTSGQPLATLDLQVGFDVAGLQRAIGQMLPGEQVRVSAQGDGLVLSGVASSSAAAARAAALAERYAAGKVVNLMAVTGPEQVMLSVHVAEVQRSALRQLGITSLNGLWDTTNALGLPAQTLNPNALLNLFGRTMIGENVTVDALFNALETKGYASTLAEPTLTALSGETAVFFAGGEFPVPVPQLSAGAVNQITIDYKQYGVSVDFTPTVFGDTINLVVSPEVSALDRENSVVLQGFRIPGITTRRARTTVELRNGQSFAIAGLIRREFSDSLRGLPGASALPVLGALLRSTAYQNNETEVVIIVTAHLAKPTDRKNFILPTDTRQAPGLGELLLNGVVDKPKAIASASAANNGAVQ